MEALQRSDAYTRSILVVAMLSVGGVLASQFTTIPAILLDPAFLESPADAGRGATLAFMALSFVGYALVGALYLWRTGRGWSYLDLRVPTRREWGYAVGAFVVALAVLIAVNVISVLLELPAAENQALEIIGDDQTLVLLMIVIVFLFNAPAEEFLFRNVIQKRLYAAFSRNGAVVVTSLLFALIHVPTYGLTIDGSVAPASAILVTSVVIFTGSLVFGYAYAKTDNLVVPIAGHAFYNALLFGFLYLFLRLAPEELEAAMAAGSELFAATPI